MLGLLSAIASAARSPRHTFGTVAFQAHGNARNDLTLALEETCLWTAPLGAEALTILVPQAAHAMNLHHGRNFNEEVERLAGIAAALMYQEADFVSVR